MGGWDYVAKVGKVYVVALTTSWAQVLTAAQAKATRGYMVKTRQSFDADGSPSHAPYPFDLAFTSSPSSGADSDGTGFYSFSGVGSGVTLGPSNGLYAKTAVTGATVLLEIMVFE